MTTWDPTWEQVFTTRAWGRYPPEELVRAIARAFPERQARSAVRVLDLGCGTGACTWFLAREGFAATGVDGSQRALEIARERLTADGLEARLERADIGDLPYEDGSFDAAIDVGAFTCNTAEDTQRIISEAMRVLKPGGLLFSMTFKDGCWGDGLGERVEGHTFRNVREGMGVGMGVIRFSPLTEIEKLYGRFSELSIEYSVRSVNDRRNEVKHWVISGRKPGATR